MSDTEHTSGMPRGEGRRFGVVASRFNEGVVDRLLDGAVECLIRHGVAADDLSVVRVPGAWEIPFALEEMAAAGRHDALVALGAVVRGETAHFDYLARCCCDGVARVGERHRVPIGFGVLTCDSMAQAEARAGGEAGNKGVEAALAALEMVDLAARLRAAPGPVDVALRGDG